MSSTLMRAVDERGAAAKASGDLQPVVVAEQTEIEDGGIVFQVRALSSLAAKDAVAQAPKDAPAVAVPGGPRDPNFNPFLNPDPALTVGPLGDKHVVILNKFPVCDRHLVLARREFEEQLLPLAPVDFEVLVRIMAESGGLGFYNGGTAAGASQRHKHVQWVPAAEDNARLGRLAAGLPEDLPQLATATHPRLPMKHCFVRVDCGIGAPLEATTDALYRAYGIALETLGLKPGVDGLLPPYNLLIGDGWLFLVPRGCEHFEEISISAVNYGGTLYVRYAEQVDVVRRAGPMQALASVGI